MNQTTNVRKLSPEQEARQQLKSQLAQYLAQKPRSALATHTWMKRLEVASLGFIAAAFIFALIVSFKWMSVPVTAIPAAWFLFVASVLPTLMLFGIHAILLKAFPTVVLPGKPNKFVTGDKAVGTGWFFILSSVIGLLIWGYLTFKIWTSDYATMGGILFVVISVGMAATFLASIAQSILRRR
jgi:hypothetical protein